MDQAAEAPNLASTLNQGAFNLGNAGGAWLGSMALGSGLPLTGLPWMSAAIAAAALLLTLWGTRRHGRRALHWPDKPAAKPCRCARTPDQESP